MRLAHQFSCAPARNCAQSGISLDDGSCFVEETNAIAEGIEYLLPCPLGTTSVVRVLTHRYCPVGAPGTFGLL